jgi:mRNA interferase MazF
VQNDSDNQRLRNTVVAMITGNISHAHEPTQFLVDPSTADGQSSGLRGASVVKCNVLVTVDQGTILHTIGSLSPSAMFQINQCLKSALDIP